MMRFTLSPEAERDITSILEWTQGNFGEQARVRHPRHFLIYRVDDKNGIEIGRVLHDSMDLLSNLPDEYRNHIRFLWSSSQQIHLTLPRNDSQTRKFLST